MGAPFPKNRIADLEDMVRRGQSEPVRAELKAWRSKRLSRAELSDAAALARRVGLPELALKLLQPIVRPKIPLGDPATPREIAVYASALSSIGALEEALTLLKSIEGHGSADILLYLSFAHIYRWDYSAAALPLRKYIRHPSISDYERKIGMLNLAACYQFTQTHGPDKRSLLDAVLVSSRENSWAQLKRNALELLAQAAIAERDWRNADAYLGEAEAAAGDLLLQKWRALLGLERDGATPKNLDRLSMVRLDAERLGNPEVIRDCDHYLALATRDQTLAAKVYFGTRYHSFRRRLELTTKSWLKIPTVFAWQPCPGKSSGVFDVITGREREGHRPAARLKPDQARLRLLQLLTSDQYRGFTAGHAFVHLYPGEYYNPDSSPARIRRVIDRLNEWFNEHQIPLGVQVEKSTMRIEASSPYTLLLHKGVSRSPRRTQTGALLSCLRERWPYQAFTVKEAALALDTSIERARELLAAGMAANRLSRDGVGRATRYRFGRRMKLSA